MDFVNKSFLKMKAIILGNRGRVRRLASAMSHPAALEKVNSSGRNVMDWNISTLKQFGIKDVVYVGGYHIEKVVHEYPFLRFYYYENWKNGSDLEALLEAEKEFNGPTFLLTSDIIFRADALKLLSGFDSNGYVVGGIDGKELSENEKKDYEFFYDNTFIFTGIMYIPDFLAGHTVKAARELLQSSKDSSLLHLIERFRKENKRIDVVDIRKHWSPLNKRLSLTRFVLGTKAETLERLRPLVKRSIILPQVKFTVEEWGRESERIISDIQNICGKKTLVVRSSARDEDSWDSSQAGKFHTELDVDGTQPEMITRAVKKVQESYTRSGFVNKHNEILVQPKLLNAEVSGVLLTKGIENTAPYRIINYDRKSYATDTVTSGKGSELETKIVYRNCNSSIDSGWMDKLVSAAKEIEYLLDFDELDIEFAISSDGSVYFLQVRPLAIKREEAALMDEDFESELEQIKEFVKNRMKVSPYVFGTTTLLGEMPDWNPSEMIGASPRPLALSLYQRLITDWPWAEARARCGYKDVQPEPLMVSLGGRPFVDVRVSFNSFLPAGLKPQTAEKLINYSIGYLKEHPEFHDKVEFEVAFNCYTFDFENKLKHLSDHDFTQEEVSEIRKNYLSLTDSFLRGKIATIHEQLDSLKIIGERTKQILAFSDNSVPGIARQISGLMNDCIEYGIIPFSILARYAFIAIAFLRDLLKIGIFSIEEYEKFLKNIPTIATQFNKDLELFRLGKLNKKIFIERYGHLRPNSYDICSVNYEGMVDQGVFSDGKASSADVLLEGDAAITKKIWEKKKKHIDEALEKIGFKATSSQLFDFITKSIPAREKGKLEFSRNLNLILEKIATLGSKLGFSREDMSYISIERILRVATNSPSSVIKNEFERIINYENKRHLFTSSLRLPYLIYSPESVECFDLLKCHPNYITRKKVSGQVVDLTDNKSAIDIKNKIVAIRCADPGYDWIFSRSISGLITQYGGSASHMAIRAAEFGIPAAIGCGEVIYGRAIEAKFVELDCGNKTIKTH